MLLTMFEFFNGIWKKEEISAKVKPVIEDQIPTTLSEVAKPIAESLNHVTISQKPSGRAAGFVMQYGLNKTTENKVLIKGALPDLSHKNINYYEVSVADLMTQLGLKAAKKILITYKPTKGEDKNKMKEYQNELVASKWCDDLMSNKTKLEEYGERLRPLSLSDKGTEIQYWLNLYKKTKKPNDKEFYKMCACLLAVGMTDLQPGDNIIPNKEGFPIAIDTGYSDLIYLSENRKDDKWQQYIDVLLNDSDPEIKGWGKLIQGYKDYTLETVDKKVDFANVFEGPNLGISDTEKAEAKGRFTVSAERLKEIKKSQEDFKSR
jgi:hypothetical protein